MQAVTLTKDRPALSSERASHGMKNVTVRRILYSEQKKYLVISPRCGSTPRLTDWLTVSRNVTLTLTFIKGGTTKEGGGGGNKSLDIEQIYMAMGPSGARSQEWPCWLVAGSKLLLCSALLRLVESHELCDKKHERQVENAVQALLTSVGRTPLGKVRPCDIHNLANSLKLRKASGLDGIPNECLRHLPRRPLVSLTHLFNYYLRLSHFPKPWKEAKI
jgi:hypothetical protein